MQFVRAWLYVKACVHVWTWMWAFSVGFVIDSVADDGRARDAKMDWALTLMTRWLLWNFRQQGLGLGLFVFCFRKISFVAPVFVDLNLVKINIAGDKEIIFRLHDVYNDRAARPREHCMKRQEWRPRTIKRVDITLSPRDHRWAAWANLRFDCRVGTSREHNDLELRNVWVRSLGIWMVMLASGRIIRLTWVYCECSMSV